MKGYSGTAILISQKWGGLKPISVTYDFGIPKHAKEGRVVTAEFKDFFVVSVYVPNSSAGCRRLDYRVLEWDNDFHNYLKSLELKHKKPVIACGDFNVAHNEIDIYEPKGHENMACFTPEERGSFGNLLMKH